LLVTAALTQILVKYLSKESVVDDGETSVILQGELASMYHGCSSDREADEVDILFNQTFKDKINEANN
jgi:hypothetical protein